MIDVGKSVKEKSNMLTKIVYFTTFILFIVLCVILYISLNTQKGSMYIIPYDYKGKLRIIYNQKGKPPLEERDGYQVVKFPLSGIVKTSSNARTGKQHDKFFYYTKDGGIMPAKDIQVGGGRTIEDNNSFIYEFWIRQQE